MVEKGRASRAGSLAFKKNALIESCRLQGHRHSQCWTARMHKPNGGAETSYRRKYKTMRPLCNNAILKMVEKGRASRAGSLAFSKNALIGSCRLQRQTVHQTCSANAAGPRRT